MPIWKTQWNIYLVAHSGRGFPGSKCGGLQTLCSSPRGRTCREFPFSRAQASVQTLLWKHQEWEVWVGPGAALWGCPGRRLRPVKTCKSKCALCKLLGHSDLLFLMRPWPGQGREEAMKPMTMGTPVCPAVSSAGGGSQGLRKAVQVWASQEESCQVTLGPQELGPPRAGSRTKRWHYEFTASLTFKTSQEHIPELLLAKRAFHTFWMAFCLSGVQLTLLIKSFLFLFLTELNGSLGRLPLTSCRFPLFSTFSMDWFLCYKAHLYFLNLNLFLLRYSWHAILSFQVYNNLAFLTFTYLWCDHYNNKVYLINTSLF